LRLDNYEENIIKLKLENKVNLDEQMPELLGKFQLFWNIENSYLRLQQVPTIVLYLEYTKLPLPKSLA
jgi:hypothetical protein